ncbi:MAG TPA: hypothetical protein VHM24_03325 [Gemmatimonadaceae bacterium]|nr:hypothetical protein [Gemmatimonadaceae bacterium]
MRALLRAVAALCGVVAAASPLRSLSAQGWNDARSRLLVEQATDRRARQIADTALTSYKAAAHGYLTFLAQVGEGFTEPPKIVKADELALEVYWHAPNLSKQLIAGRRDTLLLPTDINYHRDHLGIVQNNFPNIIRLGDGDEVRDVPHPLSMAGLAEYDYAIRDSLQIRLGLRTLDVYEVRVRPKNDRQPRAVGAVYIDRESGEVVRMAFSFTRAALKDKELEDVSVVLENGLIEGRFWLPRRQEIEIRRTGTWLDYPARGIIRGRWEICCYEVNKPLPAAIFIGPEIAIAPRGTPMPVPFTGQLLDSLPPDVRAVTDADVAKVQEEARALVRGQALARTRSTSLSGRSVSDFIRVNRVEGLALGAGVARQLGEGFAVGMRGRYGFADERAKLTGEISFRRASGAGVWISGFDDTRGAGDIMERSLVVNSIAAQEFGSDYTDLYGVRGASVAVRYPISREWTASLDGAYDRQRALVPNARPSSGRYESGVAAAKGVERRLSASFGHPTRVGIWGFETRLNLDASLIHFENDDEATKLTFGRFAIATNFEKPLGRQRLVVSSFDGFTTRTHRLPAQHLIYLGGPVSGPGYDYHQLVTDAGGSHRLELQTPAPFVSFSLGRYGRTPASVTLAPFVNVIWKNEGIDPRLARSADIPDRRWDVQWYPSVGVGMLSIFDLIRIDVARGTHDGRWTFSADVSRDLWRIL